MAEEVLDAKTAQREQAHPKLRITGGSEKSTLPPPCVILLLWDSSQCQPGEIQREALPETVGGSGRLWPTLTERDFVIWGKGEHMENRFPRDRCCGMGGHTGTVLKE